MDQFRFSEQSAHLEIPYDDLRKKVFIAIQISLPGGKQQNIVLHQMPAVLNRVFHLLPTLLTPRKIEYCKPALRHCSFRRFFFGHVIYSLSLVKNISGRVSRAAIWRFLPRGLQNLSPFLVCQKIRELSFSKIEKCIFDNVTTFPQLGFCDYQRG